MLTGHQRIALRRAGIAAEEWSDGRILLTDDDAGLWLDVKGDGIWDHCSGFGSPPDVDRLRQCAHAVLDLKYWTPPTDGPGRAAATEN